MDTKVKSRAIYAALMPKLTKKAFMLGAVLYWHFTCEYGFLAFHMFIILHVYKVQTSTTCMS